MRRFASLLVGLIVAGAVLIAPGTTYAASNALGVNPRRDYTIKPGEKVSDTLNVSNLDKSQDLTVGINVIDFGPMDETGSPSLKLKESQPTSWSLKPFLTIPSSYTIKAGQSVDIPFTVSIPAKQGAGSYYSAIRYSAVADATGKNINLGGSTMTLMFVTVPGKANENLLLKQFGAFTPNSDGTGGVFGSFYGSTTPKYLSFRLQNTGNVAENPEGSLILNNMFGKKVEVVSNVNPNQNLVLLGQTRRYDVCLNEEAAPNAPHSNQPASAPKCNTMRLWPGHYTAKLALIYGNPGGSQQNLNGTTSFWYLPGWFVIGVLVLILFIAGIIWLIVNAIKNRGGGKYRTRR